MRHYFLGLAANYSAGQILRHTFTIGSEKSRKDLAAYLAKKYEGEAYLTSNGRSALTIALRAYFKPRTAILVNGFTCYAVYEAIKAAKLTPIWVDINPETLNFDVSNLEKALNRRKDARGIIIQNSLGHVVNIDKIERFAHQHNLVIIEDLAHSAGMLYPDGRETGRVGEAAVFSFGKDKAIDAVTGGAVVLRRGTKTHFTLPPERPRFSDVARARFYPLIGLITRALSYVHLSGSFMRLMLRLHFVEKSADSPLNVYRMIPKFVAKLALEQFKAKDQKLSSQIQKFSDSARRDENSPEKTPDAEKTLEKQLKTQVLRNFYLVDNRDAVLKDLKEHGYYFSNFWYEKPVSPARYYKKVHFPEGDCPVATLVSASIVNFPTYYSARALKPARKIVKYHELDGSTFIAAGKVANALETIEKTKKKLSR